MYRLSQLIILFLGFALCLNAQSENPHGEELKMDCAACHTAQSWDIPTSFWTSEAEEGSTPRFDHGDTRFALDGQHAFTDCRFCHESLVFSEANSECISCHVDIHEQTVGTDCARCHTIENWLIDDVADIHLQNGFPLLGSHATASCDECHVSSSDLQFPRIGNDCFSCHQADYQTSTNPDHVAAGYSIECLDCHEVNANDWSSANILHDFFPLVQGHDIADCQACHTTGNFSDPVPTDCIACHQDDFNNTTQPDHQTLGFSNNCAACHTLAPDWMPAFFPEHDALYFPIYSGNHAGEWTSCAECHTTPNNYSLFSCTDCHEHNDLNELANDHNDVPDYSPASQDCYACHPNGD